MNQKDMNNEIETTVGPRLLILTAIIGHDWLERANEQRL